MTTAEHLAYHTDKLERLHAETVQLTAQLAKYATNPKAPARSTDVLVVAQALARVEADMRVSSEICSTLRNIQGEQGI